MSLRTFMVSRVYDTTKDALRNQLRTEHLKCKRSRRHDAECNRQRQHHNYKSLIARLSLWLLCVARIAQGDLAATLDNERQWHLVVAEDESAARAFIEGDPFRKAGIYEYQLNEVKKLRGEL